MTLIPPNSTLTAIRTKIRRLTASSSEQSLTTDTIDQAINTFYLQDFPYAIKLDQMRSVYIFYTAPNIDRYPLNVNFNQGIRSPVYFEGVAGYLFKDRGEFYGMWPRSPTQSTPFTGNGTQAQTLFTVGGAPFLSKSFVLGGTDSTNTPIRISDDGNGNLYYMLPNPVVLNPSYTNLNPGMKNANLSNVVTQSAVQVQTYPGDQTPRLIGTVNYITGAVVITWTNVNITPKLGSNFNLWVSQYDVGRPYSLLFFNNEFEVRPVPDNVYKVEVETYLSPVQFLETTDNPILNQWWQYISYGVAMEIQRERNDTEGVEALREGFMRQEALVLERQGVEEIGQRNSTIFSGSQRQQGWGQGMGWPN